ncbi:MAG: class I SAM-dependent methyltransferase [Candidatus Bathyarchaeia archaeon]
MVIAKGDTERQAILRDKMIKRGKRKKRSNYVLKISAIIKSEMKLLDIGCGTAHIIEDLAIHHKNAVFIGLDVSPAMLKIARLNTKRLSNVMLVEGDGLKLPFSDYSFDVAITRLAEYSLDEVCRVLKGEGSSLNTAWVQRQTKKSRNFSPEESRKKISSF